MITWKSKRARRLVGIAAIVEMLDCIGRDSSDGDKLVAKILVENEAEIGALVQYLLSVPQ